MRGAARVDGSAIVAGDVELAAGVVIGAYAIIGKGKGGPVLIGEDVLIEEHCIVYRDVAIGAGCSLDPFSRVGPAATLGERTRLLYGARVHSNAAVGADCVVAGNVPDQTRIGSRVVHLGKISHGFHYPFADWDGPEEQGPTIGDEVVIATDANIIGPVSIGANVFVMPREIVRTDLPANGVFKDGRFEPSLHWRRHLRLLGKGGWATGRKDRDAR